MLAQHCALDSGGNRRGHHNPCQHCLIQIADYFFDSESDGGNRRIESRSDTGRSADRQQSFEVFARERSGATKSAGNAGTDLNSWSFTSERRTGADLQDADEKLPTASRKKERDRL